MAKPKDQTVTNPQTNGPAAHCSFTRWEPVEAVVANPRNPNRHSADQVKRIAANIAAFGWRVPIGVSKRSGFVVRGHGRLQAAIQAGWSHVPIDVQEYESEAHEWADMVADNRIAELSSRDEDAVAQLVTEVQQSGLATQLTGYTVDELQAMVCEPPKNEDSEVEIAEAYEVIAECTDENQQQQIFQMLTEKGIKCRLVTL